MIHKGFPHQPRLLRTATPLAGRRAFTRNSTSGASVAIGMLIGTIAMLIFEVVGGLLVALFIAALCTGDGRASYE